MIVLAAIGDGQAMVLVIGAISAPLLALAGMILQHLNNRVANAQRTRVEKELQIVKHHTNARLGESLRVAMLSAHLVASQDPTPENKRLALEAEEQYLTHKTQMADSAEVQQSQPKPT